MAWISLDNLTQAVSEVKAHCAEAFSAIGHTHTKSDITNLGNVIDTAGTGLSKLGTTLDHANSIIAGGVGPSASGSGHSLTIPYVYYNATGHVTNAYSRSWKVPRGWYGTCSTPASTTAKYVTCSGFELIVGAMILVTFTYTNQMTSPTLNVNATGAKSIYHGGNASYPTWRAGESVLMVYDGTYWRMLTSFANFGTLPIGYGGTGANDAAAARTNLSVYSKDEVDSAISAAITGVENGSY